MQDSTAEPLTNGWALLSHNVQGTNGYNRWRGRGSVHGSLSVRSGTCRVVAEPRDVSLIARVEEDRSTFIPALGVDKVSLLECPGISCIEVVQLAGEEEETED